MIRATFEIGPAGGADALAVHLGAGVPPGADAVRARVVEEHGGRAVVEVPESNWGVNDGVGAGPWSRNDRYGATASVLARLTRLCGADYVIVRAFGRTLFDDDQEVEANLEGVRGACGAARPAVAVLGGGLGP